MSGYTFFRGGTRLMAFLSLGMVVLIVLGIFSSTNGGKPFVFTVGSVIISSATLDGAIALAVISVWIGLLSAGILTRDRFIRGSRSPRP